MKQIALVGRPCHVYSEVLSALHKRDVRVHLTSDDAFAGCKTVVITYDDCQTDAEANDYVRSSYPGLLAAARKAGVERVIVVGSPQSAAFFEGYLRRHPELNGLYISTEGDFGGHVASEVVRPLGRGFVRGCAVLWF